MHRPYEDFDKEIHSQIAVIWNKTPDLRVIADYVKGMRVEILTSAKHPEKIGITGIATGCGILEKELYISVNFSDPAKIKNQESISQIFFLPEVRFLR